jgi:hypothetical protein
LPDNQWELEAEIWFSIGLAHLQRQVVAWSSRQAAPNPEDLNLTLTPEEAWLCQNQIIRGTSYQSFNVLALVLIFVSGILISIFSMFVDDLTFYCQRKFKRSTTRREICENKDALQLQRMLYERPGEGTWHDGSGGVPVARRRTSEDFFRSRRASLLTISTKVPEIAKGSLWSRCRNWVCTTDSPIS